MTMTSFPAVEVTAQTPTPYPFGLGSLAPVTPPAGSDRWMNGVWWRTSGCLSVAVTYGQCNVDAPDPVPALVDQEFCGIGEGYGFTVYAKSGDSVRGSDIGGQFTQVRDVLQSGEQWAVERELWNRLQTATPSPAVTVTDIGEAVAQAEQRIVNVYGGTGTIHVSRLVGSRLATKNVIKATGNRMLTQLGTPVIVGGGYGTDDLTDPGEVIVTGAVVVIRGQIEDVGPNVDPQFNNISAIAARDYVVGWDCTAIRIVGP